MVGSPPKTAAFIIASDTHLEIAEEISEELRRRGPCKIWAISTRRLFFPNEYPLDRLQKYFDRFLTVKTPIPTRWQRLARKIKNRLSPGHAVDTRTPLSETFPELFQNRKPVGFDFVFILNDRGYPDVDFIRAFQSCGIPVGLVQESIRRDDSTSTKEHFKWNGQGGCDAIFAWGPTSVDYYARVGAPKERVVMTGNPRIDRYVRRGGEMPAGNALREKLSVPVDRPVFLIATNPVFSMGLHQPLSLSAYIYTLGRTLDWIARMGAHALVKPHLLEKGEFERQGVSQWMTSFKEAATYCPDLDLAQAIKVSDAVLVFNSTVALEAALLGKPSGLLAADDYGHGTDFLETGLSRPIRCEDDLKALLTGVERSGWQERINQYLCCTEGSAHAIVDYVSRWLAAGSRPLSEA